MSDYTLYLGDCLEYMRTMEPGSVDAIITDLPYGTTACSWDEIIPFVPMWEGIKRILKPRGAFVTTASQPFTTKLIMSNLDWFKYEWIWLKNSSGGFVNAKNAPLQYHENILVFCNEKTIYNPIMGEYSQSVHDRFKNNNKAKKFNGGKNSIHDIEKVEHFIDFTRGSYPKAEIYFSSVNNANDGRLHPSEKPIDLYSYLIQTYTNPDALIFDMCMGSGTTGVAALQLGRQFIGCEIDANYFSIAEKRIKQAAAQMLLPLEIKA